MGDYIRILFYSTCSLLNYDESEKELSVKLKSIILENADLEDKAMIYFCTAKEFELRNDDEFLCSTRCLLYTFLSKKYKAAFSEKGWVVKEIPGDLMEMDNFLNTHFDMMSPQLKDHGLDEHLKIDRKRFDVLVKCPYLDGSTTTTTYEQHLTRWRRLLSKSVPPAEFREFLVNTKRMINLLLLCSFRSTKQDCGYHAVLSHRERCHKRL